jgi:hypothetical protein
VSQPRISVYAGSADGNAVPTRVLQGAKTLQARTSHYIAVDSVRDELIVPNPFAQAILFFRGGARGDEAPIRVLQGPKTMMNAPDNVAVDSVHGEIYIAQFPTDSVLVFRSDASGDAAPIRILHGPNTKLDRPIRVEVDPVNNLLAATTHDGIVIFNRTDQGDVAPKWVISGPKTGLGTRSGTRDVKLFPEGKKILAIARLGSERQPAGSGGDELGGGERFLGVWKYGDTGDVAPWAMLRATETTGLAGSHVALNRAAQEVLTGGTGVVRVYHIPEIFEPTD